MCAKTIIRMSPSIRHERLSETYFASYNARANQRLKSTDSRPINVQGCRLATNQRPKSADLRHRLEKKPDLNTKTGYKRERPSHFRQHLISILIKSCNARGRSDMLLLRLPRLYAKFDCLVARQNFFNFCA